MITNKTQTGRTQRMLNAAIDAARAEPSKKFVALFPSQVQADDTKKYRTFKAPSNLVFIGVGRNIVTAIDYSKHTVTLTMAGEEYVLDAFIDHDVCEMVMDEGLFSPFTEHAATAAARWDAKPGEYGYKP